MSRFLLAGLFIFSLAIVSGCGGTSGGEAVKGETTGGTSEGISGMSGEKDKGNALPPPPPLQVPPGEQ